MNRNQKTKYHMPETEARAILKAKGAILISTPGVEEFRLAIDRYAETLADITVKCSRHAKRKVIKASDVKLAMA